MAGAAGYTSRAEARAFVEGLRRFSSYRRPNHYRELIAQFDARRAASRAQVKLALAEGVQVVEHALSRIERHREAT